MMMSFLGSISTRLFSLALRYIALAADGSEKTTYTSEADMVSCIRMADSMNVTG